MADQGASSMDHQSLAPWVAWFTASIRQEQEWLTYAFASQADMFRSFTTSALNSFTNNLRCNINSPFLNRLAIETESFTM